MIVNYKGNNHKFIIIYIKINAVFKLLSKAINALRIWHQGDLFKFQSADSGGKSDTVTVEEEKKKESRDIVRSRRRRRSLEICRWSSSYGVRFIEFSRGALALALSRGNGRFFARSGDTGQTGGFYWGLKLPGKRRWLRDRCERTTATWVACTVTRGGTSHPEDIRRGLWYQKSFTALLFDPASVAARWRVVKTLAPRLTRAARRLKNIMAASELRTILLDLI